MNSDTFYTRFFHASLLALLVIICYSNTLHAPWHFDDFSNIVENHSIRIKDLSWAEIKKVFNITGNEDAPHGRPVATFSFALNYFFSKYNVTSYHIVNICLHLISVWIVYLVFLQTLFLTNTRFLGTDSEDFREFFPGIALFGSALWAIHPIHTQAVTYIVQRQAVLAAMFYMLALYCYIRARLCKGSLLSTPIFVMTAVFYLLAMGSKQNAAILPLSLVGYEVAFLGYPLLSLVRSRKTVLLMCLAGLFIPLVILWLKEWDIYDNIFQPYEFRTFTLWERLITEPIVLFKYIFLLVTPLSDFLTLESDMMPSRTLFEPPYTIVAVIAISCLSICGVYLLKRQPIVGYAIFFFVTNHLIESTFLPLELYFEHRNYLPSIFIYLAMSYFFIRLLLVYRDKIILQSILIVFCISYIVSEGNATFLRNDIYGNNILLMEDAIDKSPYQLRPYITVSSYYMKLGSYDKAKQFLKNAEKLYDKNNNRYQINIPALIYYNAGALYSSPWEKRDVDKAIALLVKSCDYYPFDYMPHALLGTLYFEKGDYKQAEIAMENASVLKENLSSVYYQNYGRVLYSNNKIDEAIKAFLTGLQVEREASVLSISDLLLHNLVAAYLKKGEFGKAKDYLDKLPRNSTAPVYLLCYALLYPGAEGDLALQKLASLLAANNVSYCEWVEKFDKNDAFGVIYPDIHVLEPMLKSKYLEQLALIRDKNGKAMAQAKSCNIAVRNSTPENLIEMDNSERGNTDLR